MNRSAPYTHPSIWMVIAALVCAAGIWLFLERVLIPYQIADASAFGRPRGNLSDLYPRWLGARELLLHGRDPYSAEVTREIQVGYYGRVLDPRLGDPTDQQGFAYPVYVVFALAPTVQVPFELVQKWFFAFLILLTAASALIWLRTLDWRTSFLAQIVVVILSLGNLAVMQGLKLEQMSLLIAGLIEFILLLIRDYQVGAGIVLALASMKPQLVVLLLLWLGLWTFGDLRRRYRWAVSFAVAMVIQISAGEWFLPRWVRVFGGRSGIIGTIRERYPCSRDGSRTLAWGSSGNSGVHSVDGDLLERTRPSGQLDNFRMGGKRGFGVYRTACSYELGLQSGTFDSGAADAI